MEDEKESQFCQFCEKTGEKAKVIPLEMIDSSLLAFIKEKYPQCSEKGFICDKDLSNIRLKYVEEVLRKEKGELGDLEDRVFKSLQKHESIVKNLNMEFENKLSFGARLSDKLANFGGSWSFIIIFLGFLALWIIINSMRVVSGNFDPYPFIFLNLILSSASAIQAPVIMMSQNRMENKDRLRAKNDYVVNLKAELEIRNLNEKIDNLLVYQWQRLLEIQKIQLEIMNELAEKKR